MHLGPELGGLWAVSWGWDSAMGLGLCDEAGVVLWGWAMGLGCAAGLGCGMGLGRGAGMGHCVG